MYCTKCGNKLNTGDRFCGNCGAPVGTEENKAAPVSDDGEMKVSVTPEEKTFAEPIKVITPTNDFKWDVQYYPDSDNRAKTKEIDFDWGDTARFGRRPERKKPDIDFEKDPVAAIESEPAEDFAHVEIKKESVEDSPVKETMPADTGFDSTGTEAGIRHSWKRTESAAGRRHDEREEWREPEELKKEDERLKEKVKEMAAVNKFYTFNSKNEEFQKLLDREYERLGVRKSVPTPESGKTGDEKPFEILGMAPVSGDEPEYGAERNDDPEDIEEDRERREQKTPRGIFGGLGFGKKANRNEDEETEAGSYDAGNDHMPEEDTESLEEMIREDAEESKAREPEKDLFATGELSIQEQYEDEINSREQQEIRQRISEDAEKAAKAKEEEALQDPSEEWPEFDPGAHLHEMAKARELFFDDDISDSTLIMNREKFSRALEEESRKAEAEIPNTKSDGSGQSVQEGISDAEKDTGPSDITDTAELEKELFGSQVPEGIPEDIPDKTKNRVKVKKPLTGSETQPIEMADAAIEMAKYRNRKEGINGPQGIPYGTEPDAADSFFDDDDDLEYEREGRGGKIAVIVLSVILVIMVALLVVRIAFPETVAAMMIDNVSNTIVEWIQGIIGN